MDLLFADSMKMKVMIFLLSTFVWCIRFFLIIDFLNVHYLFLLNLYMFMFTDRKYLELMFQWSMGHCGIYHIIIRPASTYAISGARVGSNNSYKPITNTAWVCAQLCILQKRVHSTCSRKWLSLPDACPRSVVLSGYSGFLHH